MTDVIVAEAAPQTSLSRARSVAVLALSGLTIFVAITFEMLPIGLLSTIASDLGTSDQGAGLLVSSYSLVVVLTAIPLSAVVAKFDARRILLGVLAAFVVSAVALALSNDLVVAVAARLLGGLAHAVLYTSVYRIALAVVAKGRLGIAAAAVSGGNAVALSLGVPAATALGFSSSWQFPIAIVAGAFVVLALLTVLVVPRTVGQAQAGMTTRAALRAASKLPLLRVGATIALLILAHFITYTYVEPLLRTAGVPAENISYVLLGFGVAGVVGLLGIGLVSDRHPAAALRVVIALVAASLITVWFVQTSALGISIAVIVWGLPSGALPVLVQVLALRASPQAPEVAPSVTNASFNVGITLGAVVGGQISASGSIGATALISAAIFAVMLVITVLPRCLPKD